MKLWTQPIHVREMSAAFSIAHIYADSLKMLYSHLCPLILTFIITVSQSVLVWGRIVLVGCPDCEVLSRQYFTWYVSFKKIDFKIYFRSFSFLDEIILFSAPQNSFPSPSQSVFPPPDQTPAAVSPKITAKDSNYTDPIRLQSNLPPRHDSFDDVSTDK